MTTALLVALGGAAGALARYGLSSVARGDGALWMILGINVVGSFLLATLVAAEWGTDSLRTAAGVGFLGGFTTYSTFSLQAITAADDGRWVLAASYVAATVLLGFVAAAAGVAAGRALR